MKKRIKSVITIIMTALILCLLFWRLWPQSFSRLISVSEDSIAGFSGYAMVNNYEKDDHAFYHINESDALSDAPDEILEILATSGYRQDLRNLLPCGIDGASGDKNYDGRMITLYLYLQDQENKYIEFQFLSSSLVVIRTADDPHMRIYHPTNSATFKKLVEYLQTNGTTQ